MTTARISQRQIAFRADFRARIANAYSGWGHVALIAAIGLGRHLAMRPADASAGLV